jgi:hypothetical protein
MKYSGRAYSSVGPEVVDEPDEPVAGLDLSYRACYSVLAQSRAPTPDLASNQVHRLSLPALPRRILGSPTILPDASVSGPGPTVSTIEPGQTEKHTQQSVGVARIMTRVDRVN